MVDTLVKALKIKRFAGLPRKKAARKILENQ
jgi:hypothetical protein